MSKKIFLIFLLMVSICSRAQILGGGTLFSNAVIFNQSWISGCPGGGTGLSNQAAFEPTTTMDPCASSPACVTGTTESDVWFSFFALATTASIVVAPSSSFDVAIQAFSGSACPGLTEIGCVDAAGNNATETLNLTGLTPGVRYYFRIFGATASVANRTGTYTFCGSTGLGSTALPVNISRFSAFEQNGKVILDWTTESESNNLYFEIERSINGNNYELIGRVAGTVNSSQTIHYSFTDLAPSVVSNYYRLKQVDIDGKHKYSNIVTSKRNVKLRKAVSISPNPVIDKINIRISSDVVTNGGIKIFDALGQSIFHQNDRLVKGENIITINRLPYLSKGVYTLQVVLDKEILTSKFLITN